MSKELFAVKCHCYRNSKAADTREREKNKCLNKERGRKRGKEKGRWHRRRKEIDKNERYINRDPEREREKRKTAYKYKHTNTSIWI